MEKLIFQVCGGGLLGIIGLLGLWSFAYIASGRAHLDSRLRSVSR